MSEPLDTAAIRAEWDDLIDLPSACDEIHALCDEIDRLRERLAEAEAEENEAHRAECDQLARWLHEAHKARRGAEAERDAVTRHAARLDARLAEVEAERDHNKEMWDLGVELLRKVEAERDELTSGYELLDEMERHMARAEAAEARLAESAAHYYRAVDRAEAAEAKLAAVRDRLKTAGVLTVNFAWRDELLALIDQEA